MDAAFLELATPGGTPLRRHVANQRAYYNWMRGDTVIPVACSQGVGEYFGTDDYTELAVPGGHIGLFMGANTLRDYWPQIARWIGTQ